jgi:hypothetical protein
LDFISARVLFFFSPQGAFFFFFSPFLKLFFLKILLFCVQFLKKFEIKIFFKATKAKAQLLVPAT